MKDRIPRYPGRVKLEPVAGQTNVYDMIRADEPTQEGTPLNKASLLTDDTAASFGLDASATVNDAFQMISAFSAADGLTLITVLDEDGSPIQGVKIDGLVAKNGGTVSTGANGTAIVVCTVETSVKLTAPFWDLPEYTVIVQPKSVPLNKVTITMPYLQSEPAFYTQSETKKFRKQRAYDICVVGAGGGGGGLYVSWTAYIDTENYQLSAYVFGGGGGAVNSYYGLTPDLDADYEMVVGAGGAAGRAASDGSTNGGVGGTTSFMGKTAAGGNGAGSLYSTARYPSYGRSERGTIAPSVENGTESGESATVFPFGNSTIPASGGGASGIGTVGWVPYGGHNPCGGGSSWYSREYNGTWSISSGEHGLIPGGGGGGQGVRSLYGSLSYETGIVGHAGGNGGVYIRRSP